MKGRTAKNTAAPGAQQRIRLDYGVAAVYRMLSPRLDKIAAAAVAAQRRAQSSVVHTPPAEFHAAII